MQIIHLHRFVTQEHLAMNVFINFQIKRSTCKTVLVTGKQSTCTHVPTKNDLCSCNIMSQYYNVCCNSISTGS